jgi:tetratricopeptide (TPR) repeat protein
MPARETDPRAVNPTPNAVATQDGDGGGTLFSAKEVARLFDLPESRLRYWSQTGFLVPSIRREGRALYSFQDLVSIKVAKGLLDAGLPLQRVRRSLGALRVHLPGVDRPLTSARIRCDVDRVLVSDGDATFEAATGQLLLDFEVAELHADVARVLAMPRANQPERSAWDWFSVAREHESAWESGEAESELQAACEAYRRALELEPNLAAAACNLGSLLAESGDLEGARDAFDEALRADPDLPEARANLAELALQDGDFDIAIDGFQGLLADDPDFVEAHYGLGRAYLSIGKKKTALAHLDRFCRAVDRLVGEDRTHDLLERRNMAARVAEDLRRELGRA